MLSLSHQVQSAIRIGGLTLGLHHFHYVKEWIGLWHCVEGWVWICVPVGGYVIMMDSVYGEMSIHFLLGAWKEMTSLTFHCTLTPARSHSAIYVRSKYAWGLLGDFSGCPCKMSSILLKYSEKKILWFVIYTNMFVLSFSIPR